MAGSAAVDEATVGTTSATATQNVLEAGFLHFAEFCRSRWPSDQGRPMVVTRAPGRLDCMGGMADFSGALALQLPLGRGVYVAAGRREDQKIVLRSLGVTESGQPAEAEFPLAALYQADGRVATPSALAAQFETSPWVRHIAGVCLGMLRAGLVPHFGGGLSLVIQSDVPARAGLGMSSAIQVAVAKALVAVLEVEISDGQLLSVCREANTHVVGAQPGLVDHQTCLWGETGVLLQIRCQSDTMMGTLTLPQDVRFAAVDSGVRLPIYDQRYADNRVSALIGKFFIERLMRTSGTNGDPLGGYLANIAPSEYVRRFRNELPVKMKGRDFLGEYDPPEDLAASVDPGRIYKIRSRTEHHIYENDRTHRFLERLARVRRTQDRVTLTEAGELMYASHWSYGQRCGMGSIETDVLVSLIRGAGVAKGLFGAKVTGGGCGGAVAVLMTDTPTAQATLDEACAAYAAKTGKTATVLRGSSPGATAFGVRYLD
ncbi:MAG: hypothetical protein KA354_18710 [Phycisphaerae bacterium]|nr:hypothetical protein [Phycisphaerae bacterium]